MAEKEKFIDYYAVLQIWPTASEDVVKKAYFSLAKLHHPDISSKGEAAPSDEGVDFKLINEAYQVLIDPVRRREYDEKYRRLGRRGHGKKEADRRSAMLAFEQARAAMKHSRYDKAALLLKSAIKYDDSNPAYHSYYGYCLAMLNTRLHEARDACKRALEMEFYNPDYHAHLGFVYERAGLKSTARECFMEALKWDPEHPIAAKHIYGSKRRGKLGLLGSILSLFKKSQPKPSPGSSH